MEVPLPWERLLWSGRSLALRPTRYVLTDFRLVSIAPDGCREIALYDVHRVQPVPSLVDRLLGRSTIIVYAADRRRGSIPIVRIRRGEQLATVIELLAGDPSDPPDPDSVRQALNAAPWQPRSVVARYRNALVSIAAILAIVFGVANGLHGKSPAVVYPRDDQIYPAGLKRDRDSIVRFMESSVMPWARTTLAPIVGGEDRVTCETCHGSSPDARDWQMPGVAELPKPDIADRGWEQFSSTMDAQMRNAIYGYVAESDNQARAKYMREVVMPGMAALLHRPAYDFTRNYEYNLTHAAFGCYHCHRVR
ncbi:MAG TPA: hypothetical protein VJP86_13325 [Vicinamibacterales bacterium]|jgi:hypothetical protein|nr:hypothetical protein [Vicinamibacterales bacterium]